MVQLSLVLACYNEGQIFDESMREITRLLETTNLSCEIILVEDRSRDNTAELIKKFAKKNPHVKTIFHEKNEGRGKTVSDGFRAATGEVVGFIDVDLEIPAIAILSMYLAIGESDGATARRIYRLNPMALHRHILSKGYSWFARWLLKIPFEDTETGCKFFRRSRILPVLEEVKDHRWFWDTEIMVLAQRRGLKIREIPTLFIRKTTKTSTVRIFSDTREYFSKLFSFRRRLKEEGLL